jgi:hypothetical protein
MLPIAQDGRKNCFKRDGGNTMGFAVFALYLNPYGETPNRSNDRLSHIMGILHNSLIQGAFP